MLAAQAVELFPSYPLAQGMLCIIVACVPCVYQDGELFFGTRFIHRSFHLLSIDSLCSFTANVHMKGRNRTAPCSALHARPLLPRLREEPLPLSTKGDQAHFGEGVLPQQI